MYVDPQIVTSDSKQLVYESHLTDRVLLTLNIMQLSFSLTSVRLSMKSSRSGTIEKLLCRYGVKASPGLIV